MNETAKSVQVGRHSFAPIVMTSLSAQSQLALSSHFSSPLLSDTTASANTLSGGAANQTAASRRSDSDTLHHTTTTATTTTRPLSAFDKAGVTVAGRGLLAGGIIGSSMARPPTAPNSAALVVSKNEDAAFDPALPWYESHLFYAKKKAKKTATVAGKSRASMSVSAVSPTTATEGGGQALGAAESTFVPEASESAFDDSFFTSRILGGAGAAGRPRAYVGPYAARTQEIIDAYTAKGGPPPLLKPLTAVHQNLSLHLDESGMLPFDDVVEFLQSLVPALDQELFKTQIAVPWLSRVVASSSVATGGDEAVGGVKRQTSASSPEASPLGPQSSSVPGSPNTTALLPTSNNSNNSMAMAAGSRVPYCVVLDALIGLFSEEATVRRCFDLCDLTHCGYILKDALRALRTEPTGPFLLQGSGALGTIVNPSPDLTYLVVKGAWRVFEKIAMAEDAALSGGKDKKKKKGGAGKKGQQAPAVGKRQFHVSFAEFRNAMQTDPHLVLAFVPYTIKGDVMTGSR